MPDLFAPDHNPTPFPINVDRLQDRDHPHVQRIAQALAAVIQADPAGYVLVDDIASAVIRHLHATTGDGAPVAAIRRVLVAAGVRVRREAGENHAFGVSLR
ncbi:hypothetical protein ACIP44_12415 [Streptomyces diastaticus]|uniref:hypothetical protein n=1 Tax=Streptomyces diastaticus TaxID=1956 RepID=UPI0037F92223